MLRPVEAYQIHLRPADFFTSNPALDVPSTRNQSSVLVQCCGSGDEAGKPVRDILSDSQKPSTGGEVPSHGEASSMDKVERRLSKALTGLFKSKAKDSEAGK